MNNQPIPLVDRYEAVDRYVSLVSEGASGVYLMLSADDPTMFRLGHGKNINGRAESHRNYMLYLACAMITTTKKSAFELEQSLFDRLEDIRDTVVERTAIEGEPLHRSGLIKLRPGYSPEELIVGLAIKYYRNYFEIRAIPNYDYHVSTRPLSLLDPRAASNILETCGG